MPTIAEQIRARALENLAKKGLIQNPEVSQTQIEIKKESLINNPETLDDIYFKKWGFHPFIMENGIVLNEQQRNAVISFGLNGETGCLIGPAGTGKTTTMKAIIRAAILSNRIPIIPKYDEHKYLHTEVPGVWGGSFTRIATRNLRDNFPTDLQCNVHTIHRLLEFEPTYITVEQENGDMKDVRVFLPTRNEGRPLSDSLVMFNFDESSMVGVELHAKWEKAISAPENVQVLYIGDIAQLPPVMDDSILGYKLLSTKVIELTEVYRHAGAIVKLANHIRTGNTIPDIRDRNLLQYAYKPQKIPKKILENIQKEWNIEEDGSKVTFHYWKSRLDGEIGQIKAIQNLAGADVLHKQYGFFPSEFIANNYNPITDMILMPYNKAVGTIDFNKYFADFLGKYRSAIVYEVIAGYVKHYFAVGDKVFYDREEAIITKITENQIYSGKWPQKEAITLNRWGHNAAGTVIDNEKEFHNIDAIMQQFGTGEQEERKNQSSHVITVQKLLDIKEGNEITYDIKTAAEINNMPFGYALTIHKSQGSQWNKVYCIFHNSHNRNLQRELLYTAITRAQKELYIICEPETFVQGVLSQHIKGNTLEEKAEYFKGKTATKMALMDAQKKLNLEGKKDVKENEVEDDEVFK